MEKEQEIKIKRLEVEIDGELVLPLTLEELNEEMRDNCYETEQELFKEIWSSRNSQGWKIRVSINIETGKTDIDSYFNLFGFCDTDLHLYTEDNPDEAASLLVDGFLDYSENYLNDEHYANYQDWLEDLDCRPSIDELGEKLKEYDLDLEKICLANFEAQYGGLCWFLEQCGENLKDSYREFEEEEDLKEIFCCELEEIPKDEWIYIGLEAGYGTGERGYNPDYLNDLIENEIQNWCKGWNLEIEMDEERDADFVVDVEKYINYDYEKLEEMEEKEQIGIWKQAIKCAIAEMFQDRLTKVYQYKKECLKDIATCFNNRIFDINALEYLGKIFNIMEKGKSYGLESKERQNGSYGNVVFFIKAKEEGIFGAKVNKDLILLGGFKEIDGGGLLSHCKEIGINPFSITMRKIRRNAPRLYLSR